MLDCISEKTGLSRTYATEDKTRNAKKTLFRMKHAGILLIGKRFIGYFGGRKHGRSVCAWEYSSTERWERT